MAVCTRFAPSPTGYLHVGGVRTALFSYLFAKQQQGNFLLRIEDTDLVRSTPESVQAILDGMAWLGLAADQPPVFQTQRFDKYKYYIQQLLDQGKAYKCYCSKERLEALRNQQIAQKQKARYDGHCRNRTEQQQAESINSIDPEASYVIRFKNPEQGQVVFDDLILGRITVDNSELDDLIIARSDGSPTYNFTVVIDDATMGITHVIRGNDHVNNTPRQINLYQALGFTIPHFAHVPMILGDDGQRLSKRHGAVSVLAYQEQGYLPEALLNYLVRLGWSHGDQEIFSLAEMIQYFSLVKISKSPAAFNTEKLQWINQHYLKTLPVEQLVKPLQQQYDLLGIDVNADSATAEQQDNQLKQIIKLFRERSKTLREMAEASRFCFEPVSTYNEKAWAKFIDTGAQSIVKSIYTQLSALNDWSVESLHEIIAGTVAEFDVKFPKVAQPIRIALTGNTVSPSVDATLSILGKEESLSRIEAVLKLLADK